MNVQVRLTKNEKADEILETAFELFSRNDFSDVSMKDIANKSDTTYSLIYYYFKSKDEIFHSCVKWALQQSIDSYKIIDHSIHDPVEAINMWLDINIKHSKQLKRLCRIMLESSGRRGMAPNIEAYIKYFYKFENDILTKSIARGVESGVFACDDPVRMAAFVSTGIDGIYYGVLTRPGFRIRKAIELLRTNIFILLGLRDAAREGV